MNKVMMLVLLLTSAFYVPLTHGVIPNRVLEVHVWSSDNGHDYWAFSDTTTGIWELMEFDFASLSGVDLSSVSKIAIVFPYESPLDTWRIDQLGLVESTADPLVDEYVVLQDDNFSSFFTTGGWGSGTLGVICGDDSSTKYSGSDSLLAEVTSGGSYLKPLLIHSFTTPVDWSEKTSLYFYLNGGIPSDEWLIENAISELKAQYPKHINTKFSGVVISDWHSSRSVPLHKHVNLTATFGYENTGKVQWSGRSYADGGIYTSYYSNHDPIEPEFTFLVQIVYLGPICTWDSTNYVLNQPVVFENTWDYTITVEVIGSNGLYRTYQLKEGYDLVLYPPLGVDVTISLLS